MATKITAATRAAALAATRPSDFAKALDRDPRAVRNVLRSRFGIHVSRGGAFDADVKAALLAHLEGDADAAKNYRDAHKADA